MFFGKPVVPAVSFLTKTLQGPPHLPEMPSVSGKISDPELDEEAGNIAVRTALAAPMAPLDIRCPPTGPAILGEARPGETLASRRLRPEPIEPGMWISWRASLARIAFRAMSAIMLVLLVPCRRVTSTPGPRGSTILLLSLSLFSFLFSSLLGNPSY